MTTAELLIRFVIATAVLAPVVWVLLHHAGDDELHEAAEREKRRRQRAEWKTYDGRTIR